MGIFDIFKRGVDETKDFLGGYINEAVKPAAEFIGDTAKSYVNEALVPTAKIIGGAVNKNIVEPVMENVVNPATDWATQVDQILQGDNKDEQGNIRLVEDLPKVQQAAGYTMHAMTNVGLGVLGSAEAISRGFEWLGVDSAKPLADKLADWQGVAKTAEGGFIDQLTKGVGSAATFFVPGLGVAKGAQFIGLYSPRVLQLLGGAETLSNVGMTAFEALSEAGDSYSQALSKGKSQQEASTSATNTFWANAALIGITNKLGLFGVDKGLKKVLMTSLMEGSQEFGQQVIQNLSDGKSGAEVFDGALEAGAIGSILGGAFGLSDLGAMGVRPYELPTEGGKEKEIVAIPREAYRLETKDGNKYFETQDEAANYAQANNKEGTYLITPINSEESLKVIQDGGLKSFPFENGVSADQVKINSTINEIQTKTGTSKQEATALFGVIQGIMQGEKDRNIGADDIFQQAVDQAQMEAGQAPDIIKEAIAIASQGITPAGQEQVAPVDIYHQTEADTEIIKDQGFRPGKNSIFGEAAFFGEQPHAVYGKNQIKENTKNYKLRSFPSVKEQQAYVKLHGAKNLAEAVRKEGTHEGFIIPNPELGNVYGITATEKLNKNLRGQQFITTEEARAQSKSFPFIEKLDIPLIAKKSILTQDGRLAFGKYSKGVIEFLENPHKTTVPHEAVHAYMDIMMSPEVKASVIEEVKRRFAGAIVTAKNDGYYKNASVEGLSDDAIAEEILAEDMIKYVKTGEAASNKLRKFYDWFIAGIKKMLGGGNIDIIAKFYSDVQATPGFMEKQKALAKIAKIGNNLSDIQKEYMQDPEALTVKFLQNVDVKNREVSSYQFLKDLVKSKTMPLKDAERNLLNDILDTQFNGEKKINMGDFRAAVRTELMPLDVINSETYSEYGSENVEKSDGYDHTTHIYNSPFLHGYSGHFSGDFGYVKNTSDVEIKQIPGKDQWAIVKRGVDLTEENIAENVLQLASSKEAAEKWIKDNVVRSGDGSSETLDFRKIGLFGHTRIWDEKDNYRSSDSIGGIRYVAEIQSDAFQNPERISGITKEINMLKSDIEANKKYVIQREEYLKSQLHSTIEDKTSPEYLAAEKKYLEDIQNKKDEAIKKEARIKELENSLISKEEKQFNQYKNVWHERIIREEIRRAAMENVLALRFPMPYTIAKIEGYLSENGQIPVGTQVGEAVDYGEGEFTLLTNDYDETGKAVPSEDVRGIWDFDTIRDEEVNRIVDELISDPESAEYTIDAAIMESRGLTAEALVKMKEDDINKFESLVDEIANEQVDDRFTDAKSYVEYSNDNIENDYAFATENNDVIILNDNRNIETLSFGSTENDKEDFNYEDLPKEQATVARFYDKQVNRYLSKLRKTNLRQVTDEDGYDWLETDILPEDRDAVEAFQTPRNEAPALKRTGKQVAAYIREVDTENEAEIDDYLLQNVEEYNTTFELQSLKIKDVIKNDPDVAEYVKAGEQRYDEWHEGDSDLPIVIGNWDPSSYGVMDGFNRLLTKKQLGDEFIEAWVATPIGADKYQAMSESQRADLEYRRNNEIVNRSEAEMAAELDILAAREMDLAYTDSEKEAGYQRFKTLASRRAWVLDPATDEGVIKSKLPALNIDNMLFEAGTGQTNNDILEDFKDRYYQEQELKAAAKELTPTEIAYREKVVAQKIVKAETVGRKVTLKNAMNIVRGIEQPITITKKESTLLKSRLRDMARAAKAGASFGRSEMRADLNLAFAAKLQDLKAIRNGIVAFAQQLPSGLRGNMLTTVANAKTMNDAAKAFARIDAAMKQADNKEELSKIRNMAKKVSKAMKTGKGIAVDYQKKIADVLNEYNLKNPTANTVEKLNSLSDYIEAHPEANIPAHLIKRLDTLKKISPKSMTNENLKDLNDLLGRLWSLGELKLAMKGKYDERYIQQSVEKLLTTTVNADNSSIGTLSWLHAPRVADILDGVRKYKGFNVALQKQVSHSVAKAQQRAEQIVKETTDTIAAIKEEFTPEDQAIMAFHMAKDQGLFTQAQAIISAYSGEYGWKSENDLTLTPEMQHTIDTLRGAFSQTVDYLAAVYEEIENKPFIKNDNYFPNKYDKEFDKTIDLDAPTINEMANYAGKQVNKGFTMARVKGVKKVLRTDIFNVFAEAVGEQQYYMSVQPQLNEIANIVKQRAYQEAAGKVAIQWWDRYLKGVANKGRSLNRGIFDAFLREKRMNISKAVLGYKLTSSLLQPTAIIDAYAYVYLNHGVIPANALLLRLAGTLTLPGYAKSITSRSLGLQLRKGGEQAIEELSKDRTGTAIGRALVRGGMYGLRKLDIATASAVQQTMYKQFRSKGLSEAEASREADFVMNLTQGSSEIGDVPLVLMEGEMFRTLLTFQTFVINRWGIIAHDIVRSGMVHGNLPRKLKAIIALFIMSMAGGVENILRTKIAEFVSGNKYPEKFGFLVQSLLTIPEAIPVFGNVITSGIEYGQGSSFPLSRLAENIVSGSYGLVNPAGEDKKTREKNRTKGAIKLAEALATYNGIIGTAQMADIATRMLVPPTSTRSAGTSSIKSGRPALPKPPARPKRPEMPTRPKR